MDNIFEQLDLSVFENKPTLNPAIFDLENDKMKIDVRDVLLDIADDFYEALNLKVEYSDVWLVGSNANYNWSEYSDVDVHILLPFSEVRMDGEMIKSYFEDKGALWNSKHNIKIGPHKIEMYVQDSEDEEVKSGGIYSILYDSWIRHPEFSDVEIDKEGVENFIKDFGRRLDGVMRYKNDPSKLTKALQGLSDYLHDQRTAGLKRAGEFSVENLAFKFLRNKGIGKKMKQIKIQAYDKSKNVSHGSTLGSYLNSKKQRILSGDKGYVTKRDSLEAERDKKNKDKKGYNDGIYYSIHGVLYTSLRKASQKTGEKKSTIQYRVHSKNPKYMDYKVIYKK